MVMLFKPQALALITGTLMLGLPQQVVAQSSGTEAVVEQQQSLQNLLNSATMALRAGNDAEVCQLRSQALGILNANFDAFAAVYPSNDWTDLQASLQQSVAHCTAKGF